MVVAEANSLNIEFGVFLQRALWICKAGTVSRRDERADSQSEIKLAGFDERAA